MAYAQGSVIIPPPVTEPYSAQARVSVARLKLIENLFFEMTNDLRTSAGVKPLIKNEALQAAARSHSQDMAVNHFFSHQGKGLDIPADRIQAASVCGPGVDCVLNAETLSQMNFVNTLGLGTYFNTDEEVVTVAKQMITGLINSSKGHFRAMTDPDIEEMAMGVAMSDDLTLYLTQNFIRRSPMPAKAVRYLGEKSTQALPPI